MISKLKSLFSKKKFIPANCGTVNMVTGETTRGRYDESGNLSYVADKPVEVWGEKTFIGYTTLTQCKTYLFWDLGTHQTEIPIYVQTNIYSGDRRYWVVYPDGRTKKIITYALEQYGKVILDYDYERRNN